MIVPTPNSSAGSGGAGGRVDSLADLLDPRLAAALESLDVKTRKRFAGRLMGERRSKQRGRSVEFEDYRPYVAGDDLRHIDWNVFARLDRFFIKVFEEEQDLAVHLVIDASASMRAGQPQKLLAAKRIAMAMGYLSLVSQNRVVAWVFDGPAEFGGRSATQRAGAGDRGAGTLWSMDAARGREGSQRLSRFLMDVGDFASAGNERRQGIACADFTAAMRSVARRRAGGKGVLMLLSDMLIAEGYESGLNMLASAAGGPGTGAVAGGATGSSSWETTVVQVLSPGELDPEAERDSAGRRLVIGDLRLTDCETGRAAEVTATRDLVARYRLRLVAYQEALSRACAKRSIGLLTVSSDVDVGQLMLDDLRGTGVVG